MSASPAPALPPGLLSHTAVAPDNSLSASTVVLDSVVFVLGIALLGGLLVWITKRVIIDEKF